jgi:hypothetical protein
MTEGEYIRASNLARIKAAMAIIQQIIPDYGVTAKELSAIVEKLEEAQKRISMTIEVKSNDRENETKLE